MAKTNTYKVTKSAGIPLKPQTGFNKVIGGSFEKWEKSDHADSGSSSDASYRTPGGGSKKGA